MTIAVIADTHDRVPEGWIERWGPVDEIWHLGDVCQPRFLLPFESVGCPIYVVRGNCDEEPSWPTTLTLKRKGISFLLSHVPPLDVPEGIQVVLHGHTHVPRDEMLKGVRFLNPGCVSRPNRGAPASMGWIRFDDSGFHWHCHRLATDAFHFQ